MILILSMDISYSSLSPSLDKVLDSQEAQNEWRLRSAEPCGKIWPVPCSLKIDFSRTTLDSNKHNFLFISLKNNKNKINLPYFGKFIFLTCLAVLNNKLNGGC